ncbi:MAG: choice-of-anchor J domain-containing protein, partial [Bacteroidales bacterium]|nr:choice-of-anchor J domain-containing protein [Bacteroidales bacterium]
RASRDGNGNRLGNWYQYTVDLSAFAGQKYIAIRHFNCYDQYIMCVDDIELTTGAKNTEAERHLESFKVMCTSIDGEPIFNTNVPATQPFCQLATDELVEGDHYICKVAAMYSTGMSDWLEAEWEYESCEHYAPVDGLEVTPENEGNYLVWEFDGQGGGGGGQGGQGDAFSLNFDDSQIPSGWTIIDGGSPAGYGWHLGSTTLGAGNGHNGSADLIISQSYDNNFGVVYPDNWFISPAVTLANGSQFSFWACGQDAGYAAEHCGVFVSTSGTNPSDFTMVNEWTLSAKSTGEKASVRGTRDQGTWRQYTVDLSNYAGEGRYIAIRHFNCSDMFYIDVDDIELTNGAKSNRAPWEFFNGYVTDPGAMANGADASWTKNGQGTWGPGCQLANGNRVGDSFTLTAATTINEIEVYGYQTGSSTTSTFNGLYAQIYNGNPMNGGQVVWGDANTNIMTATAFTNCYRGSDGDATGTTRPIMSVTASGLNIELEAGTYYLVYQLNGTGSSGPWAAPHAEPNIGNTGNGVQYVSTGWQTLTDGGTSTPYGVAMKLSGNTGGQGPTPTGDIIGFMIFRDGQWLAQVGPEVRDYTDIDEFGEHEYCVRVIYNGTDVLPSNNFYYAMSCPVCQGDRCAAGEPIYGEVFRSYDQVRIWWGEYAAIEGVVKYNVYRSTDNATYTMVGEVPAVEGQVKYEYIDTPERSAGTYYYQVRADYGYCESEPAVSGENPAVNYVVISVTSVDENEGFAIFPNPTKANVTIQAKDMQHITVVSVLGQVVYDADVDTDEVILNMSQYAAGMYTVRVMTENGVRVERVSVVR